MTQNLIDCIFVQRVSDLFCSSLSSALVDSVVLFVNWSIWRVYQLSLCKFPRWRQCNSVDWDGILNFVFIDPDCRRQYFDYLDRLCIRGQKLPVPLSRQMLSGTGSQWRPVEVDVLSRNGRHWHIANFTIMIVLVWSVRRFLSLISMLLRCYYTN